MNLPYGVDHMFALCSMGELGVDYIFALCYMGRIKGGLHF